MAIQLMFFSALCTALSNLCLRKSIDAGGTTKAYLMLQLSLSCIVMTLMNPVRTGQYTFNAPMFFMGIVGGILLAVIMTSLGKAMENGPAGLSVAVLNCSSVMPILVLVLLFGAKFGFFYTLWNALGSLLVIGGICWASWDRSSMINQRHWILFVSLAFFTHVAYLVFLNWRALFINFPEASGLGLRLTPDTASSQWFLPVVFLTAAAIQAYLFFSQEKRMPNASEMRYAIFGSVTYGVGAFTMVKATEVATRLEHAMLFPVFSVTLLIACNLWGRWLYKETVNWKANALCVGGIVLGMIDWKALIG